MHREKDDLDLWIDLANLTRRFNPVQQRHRNIYDDDIGTQPGDGGNQRTPVRHLADNGEAGGEDAAHAFDHESVIFCHKQANRLHASKCAATAAMRKPHSWFYLLRIESRRWCLWAGRDRKSTRLNSSHVSI